MKRLLFIVGLVSYSVMSNAQTGPFGYYQDALLYSQSNYSLGSTARMQAIGGAQIALGGDISTAVSNPAGLGFFNKSIFSFTPSLNFNTVSMQYSTFENNGDLTFHDPSETFKNNFHFANIGTVINFGRSPYASDKFKGGSMAISLSRMNDFNLRRDYEGFNNTNSVIDHAIESSQGLTLDEISELSYAAFDQYLINENTDGVSYSPNVGGFPIQQERIQQSGSHYQLNIAYGANYDDRFYFGGGMGVQILNYRKNQFFTEFDFLQELNDGSLADLDSLNSIRIENDLSVRGSGVNFNFGTIIRPIDIMTIGLSYTSPTFFSLDEEGFLDLEAEWDQGATGMNNGQPVDLASINSYQSDLLVSNFRMRSPAKVALGTALFLGKNGFITGDFEFLNYGNAVVNTNEVSPAADNQEIQTQYGNVVNIRLGGEFRIDNFRLRGGYALFPSPYKDSNAEDRENITFGFGYRNSDYYLDLAVVNSIRNTAYAPYAIADNQPLALSEIKNTSVAVTLGFNF